MVIIICGVMAVVLHNVMVTVVVLYGVAVAVVLHCVMVIVITLCIVLQSCYCTMGVVVVVAVIAPYGATVVMTLSFVTLALIMTFKPCNHLYSAAISMFSCLSCSNTNASKLAMHHRWHMCSMA